MLYLEASALDLSILIRGRVNTSLPHSHLNETFSFCFNIFEQRTLVPTKIGRYQCDQIGRFIGLWAIYSLWQ